MFGMFIAIQLYETDELWSAQLHHQEDAKSPRWAIAYKFKAQNKYSRWIQLIK
jgi:NAD-dependent DNA ligase